MDDKKAALIKWKLKGQSEPTRRPLKEVMTECQYSSEPPFLTQSLPTPLISVTTPTVLTVTVIRCLGLVLIWWWWLLLLLWWLLVDLRLALTLHIW